MWVGQAWVGQGEVGHGEEGGAGMSQTGQGTVSWVGRVEGFR